MSELKVELVAADTFVAKSRELAADDLAGFGDVVTAGADVGRDGAAVEVLLGVGADGVSEAALLADLAEEPGRDGATEGRVDHS